MLSYANISKQGEKVLDKIMASIKTMVVRGAIGRKIAHSRVNGKIQDMTVGTSIPYHYKNITLK